MRQAAQVAQVRVVVLLGAVLLAGAAALLAGGPGAAAQGGGATTLSKQSISLDGANMIITASLAHARDMGVPVVAVVYDDSGVLKALQVMDGAPITSIQIAMDKGYTAATRRQSTEDIAGRFASSPTNAASFLAIPHMTLLSGGLPISINGAFVGAVGVSGGVGGQDAEIGNAGLAALPH
jgi:uncharacterized protein GlcG (DUF336 family)